MNSDISDLVSDYQIDKTSREVIKAIKSNPRSERLALQLPLLNKVKEDDLYEVFPVESDGKMGYLYLKINKK